ncbi:MAG: hypothetical protein AAFO07_16580 [Bacteroidota bacterium]
MQSFLHLQKQQLDGLFELMDTVNSLYIKRSFSLDDQLVDLIKKAEDFFRQNGRSNKAAEVGKLHIYLETALKGIDPERLEKLKTGRRENIWISSFHCICGVQDVLGTNFEEIEVKLNKAKDTLGQVILSALQSQLIDMDTLQGIQSLDQVKAFWMSLLQSEQIALIDKQLRLTIHEQDLIILLDKIIEQLK